MIHVFHYSRSKFWVNADTVQTLRGALLLVCVAATLCLPAHVSAEPPAARFGVVRDEAGRLWFEDTADGRRFLSIGVNAVSDGQHLPRPGSTYYEPLVRPFAGDFGAWSASCAGILKAANFNTIASWSNPLIRDPGLVHTPNLYVAGFESDRCLAGLRPDFEKQVEARVNEVMAPYSGRDDVLGVFLDNEMPWWGKTAWDVLPTYTLLERAFELDAADPARRAAMEFLRARHGSIEALAQAYGIRVDAWERLDATMLRMCAAQAAMGDREAFTTHAADLFFARSTSVVRRMLPGVLLLGTRFAGDAPESVIKATARHCDVIAVNSYSPTPESTRNLLARYWIIGGKPLMVTEFSWRAKENTSGCPNTRGAGGVLATQQDRADAFRAFITSVIEEPMLVGYHWFQWADQSPQGRFDGEDSNYGIVDIEHRPYQTLLSTMRQVNALAPKVHAASTAPFPTVMPERRGVTYMPGQHPDRPPVMTLMKDWAGPYEVWNAADAKIDASLESGVMVVNFETGNEYGVGIGFRGPQKQKLSSGPRYSTDLDGYEFIVLDAEIPEGIEVHLHINEAGAGKPWEAHDTSAGDDAEAYASLPFVGSGARREYRARIADFVGQSGWGSQQGRRRIDMNAVGTIAFQLMGARRAGEARIYDLYLER